MQNRVNQDVKSMVERIKSVVYINGGISFRNEKNGVQS